MRSRDRMIRTAAILLVSIAPAACTSPSWDPTEIFNVLDAKKPLQGERKPVFPGGVPGVTQGVPQELLRGNQPQPGSDTAMGLANNAPSSGAAPAEQATATREPEPQAAPPSPPTQRASPPPAQRAVVRTPSQQARAARRATQEPAADSSVWPEPPRPGTQQAQPSEPSVWPDPPRPAAQQAGQAASSSVWPDPPRPAAQQAQPAAQSSPSPWPDPPASGTFSR